MLDAIDSGMNREGRLYSIVTRLLVFVVLLMLVGCNANSETDVDPQPSATPESAEMQELRAEEARLRAELEELELREETERLRAELERRRTPTLTADQQVAVFDRTLYRKHWPMLKCLITSLNRTCSYEEQDPDTGARKNVTVSKWRRPLLLQSLGPLTYAERQSWKRYWQSLGPVPVSSRFHEVISEALSMDDLGTFLIVGNRLLEWGG